MLQRNNPSYLKYSLIAVFATAVLFLFFGYNGWGPSAENEQAIGEISRWCERVSGGFFREPSNTLGPRLRLHSENAHKLAEYLENSEHIEKVFYPGLDSNSHKEVAEKQMDMFGGMLSFYVKNHIDLKVFWENLELFKLAVSLGGVESLIELPRLMTHDSAEGTEAAIEDDLVRISVGLENTEDLINDLEFALNVAKK